MAQRPTSDRPPGPDVPAGAAGDHTSARPSAELRYERSRFSRLLARFGLGELTDPILRPFNHSADREPRG